MSGVSGMHVSSLLLDPDGRLISAEGRIAALNRAAGGGPGEPLAVPAVATIARLSRRLGIRLARAATIADTTGEIQIWVRAAPEPTGTRIEVSGWRDEDASVPVRAGEPEGFRWETDSTLAIRALSLDLPTNAIGEPLTRVFEIGGDDALIHILSAAANRSDFADQPARLQVDRRELSLSGTARVDDDGRFIGFTGVGRFATTEPEAVRVELKPAASFTDRLDRALRTPLEQIVVHADSIGAQDDGPVRAEYVEYAQDIAGAARHLMGLVDDLVDLSAIERPDFQVETTTIDLAEIARRAAALLTVKAASGGVQVQRPPAHVTLAASGEARRVIQIMVNLIGNAVRYSPHGAIVRLEPGRTATDVTMTVIDSGKGIAASDQVRIFEKFGRVDPKEPGGNGLGLYIARRLARAMGGDLSVDSAPGQGARFTLSLPAA